MQDRRGKVDAEAAIEDNAPRIAAARDPACQLRIVGFNRADANDDRVNLVAHAVHRQARIFAADPARVAARGGDFAVQGRS